MVQFIIICVIVGAALYLTEIIAARRSRVAGLLTHGD
jgi:hypothetical protein